ncbi:MAG TPA: hypothetical protein VKU36_05930 [Candidatus Babeliales bacterium]|nr:hypothetical protein [Candidatus Babeliales bacterium]
MILYRANLLMHALLLSCAYTAFLPHQLYATHSNHREMGDGVELKDFDFDNISFDEDDYQFMEYLDTAAMDHISRTIDPATIMVILNSLNVPTILQEPLFLHTNTLNKRSLLDQPIFEPDRAEFPGKFVVGIMPFVRKTNRSNFTRNSTQLKSYLAIGEATLISKLEDAINRVNQLPIGGINIDVAEIFGLFENMTVEERQTGFMFHCMKRWRKTTLRVMVPLYYLESNFSLTPKEQDEVARVLGSMDPEEEIRFRKAHFISDKIGLGDTRIEVDRTIINRPYFKLRCGGLATIPTAWMWGGGFLGSLFPKPSTLPSFELDAIFNAIENPGVESEAEIKNIFYELLLDSLDRVAADLIDVPLGNNQHLGVGLYLRGKTPLSAYIHSPLAEKITFAGRTSIELFFPGTEKRFYINKIDEQAFGDHNFQDLSMAAENVQFLKEQAISRLFLRAFNTRIIPGVIFRWSGGAYYKGDKWGYNLGLDYWLQNKPHFSAIHAPCKALHMIDVPKAKPPVAQQSKIFGGIVLKHRTNKSTWFFSLNADASLSTKGLGQDYSLALNFESSF